ncbi:MAG TPA: UvrD-helicase domain-containing protein [Xanthobacteraceae bacterium]|nr:UvrD-helicase domain-containing protein [Xanthobacteraceae bacterium]
MRFHADLHVHSKYSRATSRDLDLEHLAYWAARKGIGVVATGDFCHPAWRAELGAKLVPAESGLFRLKPEIEAAIAAKLPPACRKPVRFLLEVEISTIYKKGEKTRKIHHLIYAPDLATVDRMSAALARIGNIASDGRPILGLDSHDLLEITLQSGPDAYLVPAHIWTPWFAVLGAMGGFDSITECYGDLADKIFAVETGLSSDPGMNWRLSMLDRYRLTSNSDAHSPGKLGREATTFDCDMDYFAIRRALETGRGYVGTVEFFPEEGKYHLDGHRKCGVRLTPKETIAHGGLCPVCGGRLTIGVEHRVEALADRSETEAKPPPTAGAVSSLVPLPEMLSEITASGTGSKAVEQSYDLAIAKLGAELDILQRVPVEDIARAGSGVLAEAIARLRAGRVIREAGYDGEYGVIRLFEVDELKRMTAGGMLFDAPVARKTKGGAEPSSRKAVGRVVSEASGVGGTVSSKDVPHPRALPTASLRSAGGGKLGGGSSILTALDDDQRAAASAVGGPVLIVAGPGSGKTRTLTHRIAHLIADRGVAAENCLAITFTRRAATEMRERLAQLLPERAEAVAIHTFHSFGLAFLRENFSAAALHRDFRVASESERTAVLAAAMNVSERKAGQLLQTISKAKRMQQSLGAAIDEAAKAYACEMAFENWIDFDDLVGLTVQALANDPALAGWARGRWSSISVDEFQDVDAQQYRLMMLLAPVNSDLCVIGDPDQAIYGFRGADAACFERFRQDYPAAKIVTLGRNYRSSGTIASAAAQVIAAGRAQGAAQIVRDMHERITIHAASTERAEAEHVVQAIEQMIGGHSFFSIDSGRASGGEQVDLSFADFAVLYRTDTQSAALCEALIRSGIPFKKHAHAPFAAEPAVSALLAALNEEPTSRPLTEQLHNAAERLQQERAPTDHAAIIMAWQRLTALAANCGLDRGRLADAVAVASEEDFFDPRADRVSLLTLHAAKGLEFRVVFIIGLEDGLLPLKFDERDVAALAEERRLFYVGMTRAKDRLILSRAVQRHWRGELRNLAASPFLADIESELVKLQQPELTPRKPEDRQLKLL